MNELTKYQRVKMYLPINGYNTVNELADAWDCTPNAIRQWCRGNMKSDRIESLFNDYIDRGDRRFNEHRDKKSSVSL